MSKQVSSHAADSSRLWLVTAAILVILAVFVDGYILHLYARTFSDFSQDYEAAAALRAGTSIYDPSFSQQNNHPPFVALFFVPLTFFSAPTAFMIWGILSAGVYLWILWQVGNTLGIVLPLHGRLLIMGLALIWHPFISHLALGQISIIVAACVMGAWSLLRLQHEELAGLLLGFATAFKLYPAILALYLLLRGHHKALGVMLLTAVLFSLLPLFWVAPQDFSLYITDIVGANAAVYVGFPANVSWASLMERLFAGGQWIEPLWAFPQLARWLTLAFSLGFLAILAWQLQRFPRTLLGEAAAWSSVCVVMLLLTPISWQHAFALLILPLGVLGRAYQINPARWLRWCSLSVFVTFSLPDSSLARWFMAWSAPGRMPWTLGWVMSLPTLGLLGLWLLLGTLARQEGPSLHRERGRS